MRKLLFAVLTTYALLGSAVYAANACDDFPGSWWGYEKVAGYRFSITSNNSYNEQSGAARMGVVTSRGPWTFIGNCSNGSLNLSTTAGAKASGQVNGTVIEVNGTLGEQVELDTGEVLYPGQPFTITLYKD